MVMMFNFIYIPSGWILSTRIPNGSFSHLRLILDFNVECIEEIIQDGKKH